MTNELENRAAEGRAKRKIGAATSSVATSKPTKRQYSQRVRGSLSTRRSDVWAVVAAVVGALPVLVLGLVPKEDLHAFMPNASSAEWGVVLFGPILLVVCFAVWFGKRSFKEQLVWLRGLPYPTDLEAYLRVMDTEYRDKASMTVKVTFERRIPGDSKRTVADAALSATDVAEAKFEGETLIVRSKALRTRFTERYDPSSVRGSTTYGNKFLHQWFRALVNQGLPPIATRYPIARLDVSAERVAESATR